MTEFNSWQHPGPHARDPIPWGTSACPTTALDAAKLLLEAVAIEPGEMFLDLVTGLGHAAGLASQWGAIATGIDRRDELLDQARRRYPNALYYPGNPVSLVFPNGFFAAIVHHAGTAETPSQAALAEAYRVLAPGGRYACIALGGPALAPNRASDCPAVATPEALPGPAPEAARAGAGWEAAGFTDLSVRTSDLGWRPAGMAAWRALQTALPTIDAHRAPRIPPPSLHWPMVVVCGCKPARK